MSWAERRIGEFVDEGLANIQTGPFGTQLKASDYVATGIPVINVRNIGYSDLRPEKLEYITESKRDRLAVHTIEKNDIVFGRKGAVDRHLFVDEKFDGWIQGSDCIRLRFSTPKINPKFISYAFLLSRHKQWMLNQCGNKATMASLNQDVVKRISIDIPDRITQDRIAEVLCKYDFKIANNKRRIELLEESTRELYKEWFVRFRFPGHEHVNIVDGIPEGWVRRTISEVSQTIGGGTPSTKIPEYWEDGEITWFVPKDLTNNTSLVLLDSGKNITELGLQKSSAKLLPPDTIMMTSRASIGFFGLYGGIACTNQGFISIIPNNEIMRMYVLHNLLYRKEEIIGLAGGTTFKEINKTTFRGMGIVVPSDKLFEEFQDISYKVLQNVRILMKEINNLTRARDLLLPRIMKGDIAV